MPLSRRYTPEFVPGESCTIGLDYSRIIPPGVGISSGTLTIYTNTATPAPTPDLAVGAVTIRGRTVYAGISGGVEGRDYQLRWLVVDTAGNVWPRTCLMLCAQTS